MNKKILFLAAALMMTATSVEAQTPSSWRNVTEYKTTYRPVRVQIQDRLGNVLAWYENQAIITVNATTKKIVVEFGFQPGSKVYTFKSVTQETSAEWGNVYIHECVCGAQISVAKDRIIVDDNRYSNRMWVYFLEKW